MKNPLVVNPYMKRKYTQKELDATPDLRPKLSEVGKGIRAFADESQAAGYGTLALGAQYLKDLTGSSDTGFFGRQVKSSLEGYSRNIKEATAGRQAPNIARYEDVKSAGDALDYTAYNLAKGIPQVGLAFTGAGAGATLAKGLATKTIKDKAKAAIGDKVTKEMQDTAKAEISKQITKGAVGGGFATTFGLEGGHAFGQQVEAGIDPSRAKVGATAVGSINGALELFTPFAIAKSFGRGDFAKKSIRDIIKNDPGLSKKAVALATLKETGQRAGKAGAKGVGIEGLTEGLQELTNIAAMRWAKEDPIFAALSDEDWSQVKNSIVAGALIGGTISGAGGVLGGPVATPEGDKAETTKADLTPDELTIQSEEVQPETIQPKPLPKDEFDILGVPVGESVVTPNYQQKKGPATPQLEELPLQGELVDEENPTDLTAQEEQAQLEAPIIEARFKDITGQLRVGEQKKLDAPIEIQDTRIDTPRILEGPSIEVLEDGSVLLSDMEEEIPFAITDSAGNLIAEGATKEEALAKLEAIAIGKNPAGMDTNYIDPIEAGSVGNGFALEQLDADSDIVIYDPDGEVFEQYSNMDEFKTKWNADEALAIYEDYEAQQASIPEPKPSATSGISELHDDPEIAMQVTEIESQVAAGDLTQDEAANQLAGLANQLMGDPVVEAPGITKTSEMNKTGDQAGSNKGGWFTNNQGDEFYVKEGQTTDHAVSEHVAQQLYSLAGIDTPTTSIMEGDSDGFAGPVIGSQKVTEGTTALKDGFVIDAWLGNWDVVGLGNDNYVGDAGKAIRIDFGGALKYRAQGGKKGDSGTTVFGTVVDELTTLRDASINPQAAEVFKDVTDLDIIEQAGQLAKISNAKIKAVVKANYGGNTIEDSELLANVLITRKANIIAYAEELKTLGPDSATAGTATSLKHWVKGFDPSAPILKQVEYAGQNPHDNIWADIAAEDSRYGVMLINPETGKVLLRKPSNDPKTGKEYDNYAWTFAKGGAKNGEHPIQTAATELMEETGYKAHLVGQLGKPFYSGSGTGALFYVGVANGQPVEFGSETQDMKWATYEEALELVKEGTNKQGVKRDIEILKNLFGVDKLDLLSEYPVKQGAAHTKSYFESGQFAQDVPMTAWKNKGWNQLTQFRKLYVKSAAYLKSINKDNEDYVVNEADINAEVKRMKANFKEWSGLTFNQIVNVVPLPKSEAEMLKNFPIQTGKPFVVKTFHGNKFGEIIGDKLDPAKYAGTGYGGSDTDTLSDKNGVFYLANTLNGAKAYAGVGVNKVFSFYLASKNPKVLWWNKGWGGQKFKKQIELADSEGYDSIVFINATDVGHKGSVEKYHQFVSFDAQQQVRTTMLENIGYSKSKDAKVFESQGTNETIVNPQEKFKYDFAEVFGAETLAKAIDSGLLTINETSPEGSAAGTFDKETNKIVLNLDRVMEGESPMSVLLHEGGHAGMKDVLGKSLPLFHKDLLNLADSGNKDAQSSVVRSTAAVADKLGIEHTLYDIASPQNELESEVKVLRKLIAENDIGANLLQEEDLAYYIQDAVNTAGLTAPGLYRRIVNALKVWWAQSGVGQMFAQAGIRAELTQEMVVELAKAAVKKAVDGQGQTQADGTQANELQSIPNPLGATKRWWGGSKDTPLDANNVSVPEKIRAHIVDNLATIDEKSTDVHKVAEVAKSKSSAEQSKINRLFLEPLVQMAKATGLSQEKLDEWLLARHVLLDDENWQNTQKRSWMVARDLAISMPPKLAKELNARRVSLTKNKVWIDKEGKETKIPKADVADRMIELVNEYFGTMKGMAEAGTLKPQFTAWKELQDSWIKIQAHSGGLYSPGKVDANGQLIAGQPKRQNVSNAPDAYDIFHSYSEDAVQQKALQTLAAKWDEMTSHQLDLLVEGGKITDEEAIAMRTAHSHYAKTRRKSADNNKSFEFLQDGGVGGGKPKVRAGTIEYDPVVHVMQNTIAQAHSNAAAAQQNIAASYLYREVIGNEKHWEGWFTTHKQEVHHLDALGFLHDRSTSNPESFDIPVTIMSDDGKSGKTLYIRPIPQNQKAKLFAAGFNKLGAQQQGAVAKVLSFGNKIVRNMAVTFSPAFLAANIFRDPATALYNLQATEGKDYTKDFLMGSDGSGRTGLGNAWKILNSVYTDRDNADPQHIKWIEEWEHAGGRQSFTQALKEMDDGWKSFEGALAVAKNPLLAGGSKMLGWVEKYNIIVENVSRFSAYSTVMEAWQRGDIPKWETQARAQREAALISKELTTNFDRKGFSSQSIGLWNLFFNATVQGNVQVLRNVAKSKKLQKMIGGTVVMATMFDILGRAMADDDDEGRNEWNNIPSYVKDRNFVIPFKVMGTYIKIPTPWVYNSIWRMGGMLGELAAGERDTASIPVDMGILLMNTFNPMASASLMQSLSPTILDPFVQAVENKNFAGNPIKPTSFPGAAALPESQLYWGSTPKAYVGLADVLNSISGGDVAKSGLIDISPGVMHNFVNFFTAGVGKAAGQVYTLGEIAVTDKEFEVKNVPALSTYAFTPGKQVDVQLYHTRIAEILQAQKAVDLYGKGKTRDIEKQRESRGKYAKELRLVNHVKDVERQLKSIRTRMKAAQGRKDSDRVKQLKTRLVAIQQRFNKTYEQRMK